MRSVSTKYPTYRIIITGRSFARSNSVTVAHVELFSSGHSLGGAVASMAAISLRTALGTSPIMQLFTYGKHRPLFVALDLAESGVNRAAPRWQ